MKMLHRLIAVLICAAIAVSASSPAASAAEESAYKGAYYYRPSMSEFDGETDHIDSYVYADDWFRQSGDTYRPALAAASLSLAAASVSSMREPDTAAGYARKSRNVSALLEDMGFSDIACSDDYMRKPTVDSCGVICAHKSISDGDREYTLIAVVPRSAGYEAEWGNNFVLGASGDAKGFELSAEKALSYAKRYIADNGLRGDIKVWTAGYSRGAAIVNLLAGKLVDDAAFYLGDAVSLDRGDLYAYTFGTPSAADVGNHPRDEKYAGIFNIFSDCDVVAAMAPEAMGFARYGTDIVFSGSENDSAMIKYLSICNADLCESYTGGSAPKDFFPKKLVFADNAFAVADDDDSCIPADAAAYLKGLFEYLTVVTGGRENYARVYEEPLTEFFAYYFSLPVEESGAFIDSLMNDDDTLFLIASMYAYFMSLKPQMSLTPSLSQIASLIKALNGLRSADGTDSDLDALTVTRLSIEILSYLRMDPDALRRTAADHLEEVLVNAMRASGASDDLIAVVREDWDTEALAHLFSHMLLGSSWQSDLAEPLNPDNEQIRNAATILGNASNLMYDHLDEVILSRLRAADSGSGDYRPLTDAQAAGYRRVILNADPDADLNGVIFNGSGVAVGRISGGELTDTSDPWIGYTVTDQGGFLRIPNGDSYRICLTAPRGAVVNAEVLEYSVADGVTYPAFLDAAAVNENEAVILSLPEVASGSELPSGAAYQLSTNAFLRGDANGDGKVNIIDATAIQRRLTLLKVDLFIEKPADADGDGKITILDATAVQRWLVGLSAPDGIGQPI